MLCHQPGAPTPPPISLRLHFPSVGTQPSLGELPGRPLGILSNLCPHPALPPISVDDGGSNARQPHQEPAVCQASASQSLLHSDHFTGEDTATKRLSDSQSLSTAGGAGVLLCGERSAAGGAGRHCTETSLVSQCTRPGKSWLSDAGSLQQARPSTMWARRKQSKRRCVSSRVGRDGI